MKLSLFNIWALVGDELVLFNTMTGALSVFDSSYKETLKRSLEDGDVQKIPPDFLSDMIEDGYLVEDNFNESDNIKLAVEERLSKNDEFLVCVTLTKRCNFRCSYCWQFHEEKQLTVEGKKRISQMFDVISIRAKKIELDWFGGEPLTSIQDLMVMNDSFISLARQRGVQYSYSITTNGYLLNNKVVEYLQKEKPSQLTITLDGPPDIHNKSRPLKTGGGTFSTILKNVKVAVESGLRVSIRVNVSSQNADRIHELFDILEAEGLKNKVDVNLQAVVSSKANPFEEFCLSGYASAHSMLLIYLGAVKKGWIVFPPTENLRVLGYCVGEYPNRIVTDLEGCVHRCPQSIEGDEPVGKILDDGQIEWDKDKNGYWINKNPLLFKECSKCSFLPLCMGGCNLQRGKKDGSHCFGWRYDVPAFLKVLLLNEENILLKSKEKGGD